MLCQDAWANVTFYIPIKCWYIDISPTSSLESQLVCHWWSTLHVNPHSNNNIKLLTQDDKINSGHTRNVFIPSSPHPPAFRKRKGHMRFEGKAWWTEAQAQAHLLRSLRDPPPRLPPPTCANMEQLDSRLGEERWEGFSRIRARQTMEERATAQTRTKRERGGRWSDAEKEGREELGELTVGGGLQGIIGGF